MPMAEISGARRKEPRSGLYATRSMENPYTPHKAAEMMSAASSPSGTDVMPVSAVSTMMPMNAPIMNTSPWAKLIMPIMP